MAARYGGSGAPAAIAADADPFAPRNGHGNAAAAAAKARRRQGQRPPLALFVERLDFALVLPCLACAGLLGFYVVRHVQPFERAVFLADRTIAMPVVPKAQTMPGWVAPFVPAAVLVAAAAAAEFLPLAPAFARARARGGGGGGAPARPAHPSLAAAAFVRAVGGMAVALAASACLTEFMKVFCGRPRPDFLTRCVPRVPEATPDTAGPLLDSLVLSAGVDPTPPSVECTGADAAGIVESRKSFPSGHSSSASSVGLWGALYVLYSLRRLGVGGGGGAPWSSSSSSSSPSPSSSAGARLVRELAASGALLLMLFFLAWPWGVGATRFVDNRHHPSDIVGGVLLGAFVTAPFFYRFSVVSDAWDARDAVDLAAEDAAPEGGAAVGAGGGGAATSAAPAVASQV
jgi:membrane-associated phospholipid phosphatase